MRSFFIMMHSCIEEEENPTGFQLIVWWTHFEEELLKKSVLQHVFSFHVLFQDNEHQFLLEKENRSQPSRDKTFSHNQAEFSDHFTSSVPFAIQTSRLFKSTSRLSPSICFQLENVYSYQHYEHFSFMLTGWVLKRFWWDRSWAGKKKNPYSVVFNYERKIVGIPLTSLSRCLIVVYQSAVSIICSNLTMIKIPVRHTWMHENWTNGCKETSRYSRAQPILTSFYGSFRFCQGSNCIGACGFCNKLVALQDFPGKVLYLSLSVRRGKAKRA